MSDPTIVLAHGAFGDASSWRSVFDHLGRDEYTILAPAIPLRGVASDASYLGAVIDQIDGPVVLVGHSYSGCVITVAGASDKVVGLVYVAGFAPDQGESITDLQARFPSLAMGNFLQPTQLPDGSVEVSVDPQRFHDIFCADVPDADAAFMAHAQRPLATSAFEDGGRRCCLAREAVLGRVRDRGSSDRCRAAPLFVRSRRLQCDRGRRRLALRAALASGRRRRRHSRGRGGELGKHGRVMPPVSPGFQGHLS